MRTIKFRAWDGKDMLYSEKGQFYLNAVGKVDVPSSTGHEFTTHEYPVMQFTGLHDKNGTEIYEGDVVRVRYKMGENKQWETEGMYRVDQMLYRGLSLSFVKLYEPTDIEVNQYPLSITLRYADEIELDGRNNHYDRIAVKDRYWNGKIENHYSNDIEVIGNIYENPELLNHIPNTK